ncbi:hypothetical protein QN372_00225 [Undibacterium sp. RTI2.1]|uniref:hypothetical protein n=1 Tax=unclassified Undibacterium TaxID=2630295 RepID=UPI002AB46F01|nr:MULTISPECIES: hypothetical protein [unclassified Undibacterium]MDY7537567.1 hypothetical protein [Undibacterium sp. 5I1]MEB0029164.1 hypothetical protein [Undibacterium sp. RTI2.1]MEB0115472.1 hypothetical protein [Undibacterium sp. RTI2.2]MEB0231952.1 hypothetical protein [Undibacterium sp. 10I3]MEB0256303.1 hypothetical protein [Undibacterium sp. 5I1]
MATQSPDRLNEKILSEVRMIGYFDKTGARIEKLKWAALSKDEKYTTVKAYDNGVVNVHLKWIGRVPMNDCLPEYYWLFVILVKNYRPDGTMVNDPVDNDQYFPTMEDAVEAYEKFLLKWTSSSLNDDMEFEEVDNRLAPPVPELPPDPNRPEGGQFEIDGMSCAW